MKNLLDKKNTEELTLLELSKEIISFIKHESIAIVSTFDNNSLIHNSVKGIAGIEAHGKLYVIDLYKTKTYSNLQKRADVTVSVVNEKLFKGWSLQGKAKIVPFAKIEDDIHKQWEDRMVRRISNRMINHVQAERSISDHFEAKLPPQPQYLIEIDIFSITNLRPPAMREDGC